MNSYKAKKYSPANVSLTSHVNVHPFKVSRFLRTNHGPLKGFIFGRSKSERQPCVPKIPSLLEQRNMEQPILSPFISPIFALRDWFQDWNVMFEQNKCNFWNSFRWFQYIPLWIHGHCLRRYGYHPPNYSKWYPSPTSFQKVLSGSLGMDHRNNIDLENRSWLVYTQQ